MAALPIAERYVKAAPADDLTALLPGRRGQAPALAALRPMRSSLRAGAREVAGRAGLALGRRGVARRRCSVKKTPRAGLPVARRFPDDARAKKPGRRKTALRIVEFIVDFCIAQCKPAPPMRARQRPHARQTDLVARARARPPTINRIGIAASTARPGMPSGTRETCRTLRLLDASA